MATSSYPVQLAVDYPVRELNRLTTAFRIFTAIPILILAVALAGSNGDYTWNAGSGHETTRGGAAGVAFLIAAPLLMILFRQKYPRWWFDWNVNLLAFTNRVGASPRSRLPAKRRPSCSPFPPRGEERGSLVAPPRVWGLPFLFFFFFPAGLCPPPALAWFPFPGPFPPGVFQIRRGGGAGRPRVPFSRSPPTPASLRQTVPLLDPMAGGAGGGLSGRALTVEFAGLSGRRWAPADRSQRRARPDDGDDDMGRSRRPRA